MHPWWGFCCFRHSYIGRTLFYFRFWCFWFVLLKAFSQHFTFYGLLMQYSPLTKKRKRKKNSSIYKPLKFKSRKCFFIFVYLANKSSSSLRLDSNIKQVKLKHINVFINSRCDGHSISISTCGVWRVRTGVQFFRREFHTHTIRLC